MNARFAGAGLFALLVVGVARADSTPYESAEGNFRIAFPGKPKVDKKTGNAPGGGKLTLVTVAERRPDKSIFSVTYADFPPVPLERRDALLDSAIKGMVGSARMHVTADDKVPLDGHPGRDVRFEVDPPPGTNEKGVGRARAYLVGNRAYQLMVIGPASKLNDDGMKAFVDSFALLRPVAAGGPADANANTNAGGNPTTPAPAPVDRTGWGNKVDPDNDCRVLTDRSGATIVVPAKLHDLSPANKSANAPRLVHQVAGDFEAEVEVLATQKPGFRPTGPAGTPPFQGAGLVYIADADHYVRLSRAMNGGPNPNAFLFYTLVADGREDGKGGAGLSSLPLKLRLARKGNRLTAAYDDGQGWKDLPPADLAGWPAGGQVGIMAVNCSDGPHQARFSGYHLRASGP